MNLIEVIPGKKPESDKFNYGRFYQNNQTNDIYICSQEYRLICLKDGGIWDYVSCNKMPNDRDKFTELKGCKLEITIQD